MIKKWLEKKRLKRNREIAFEVVQQISNMGSGWEKFLPPVVVRDRVYMLTENGTIYRMNVDGDSFETITKVSHR